MICKRYRRLLVLGVVVAVLLGSPAGGSSAPGDLFEAPPAGDKGALPKYAEEFRATFDQYEWAEPEVAKKHLESFLVKTPDAEPYNALKYFADQKAVDLLVMVIRYPVGRWGWNGNGTVFRVRAMSMLTNQNTEARHIPSILDVVEWTMGTYVGGTDGVGLRIKIRRSARVVLERSTGLDFGEGDPRDWPAAQEMVRVTREWYGNYVKEHPEDFPPSTDQPTAKTGEPVTNGRPPRNPTPPIATAPSANDDTSLWPIWLGAGVLCTLVASGALYLRRKRAA